MSYHELRKEYNRPNLGLDDKTHMIQFDIPGAPQNPSDWIVTIEMESADHLGNWPNGAFTQMVMFPTSLENGKNRGWFNDGVYVTWYDHKKGPSHDGYTTLVDEDGSTSRFKKLQGLRLINDCKTGIAGDVYSVSYEFSMLSSEATGGWSIGVLGGKYGGPITDIRLTIVGSVISLCIILIWVIFREIHYP